MMVQSETILSPPEVLYSPSPVPYPDALAFMEARVGMIRNQDARECLWFLEHPPLITLGVRGKEEDIKQRRFPVYHTRRGGQVTYHGPGQLILYSMLDLRRRTPDVRAFVSSLEQMVIDCLAEFGIQGSIREGRVGVWVHDPTSPSGESKIAAIGVRLSRWVSFHGLSLNINPNLEHFSTIIPCGLHQHGVTSLSALGSHIPQKDVIRALLSSFARHFGAYHHCQSP